MKGWIYLIRNKDIYKIGITRNLENRMRQLKPDNVVAKLYTSDYIKLEKELHNRYKKLRIPQTEYFRLEKNHLNEIKQLIFHLEFSNITIFWLFMKSFIFLVLIFILIYMFILLTINDLNIVLLKSFLWTERFLFCFSFLSIFLHTGKNIGIFNEFKYRITRSLVFIFFALVIHFFLRY